MVVSLFLTGIGIGPLIKAPVLFTVSTISLADLSISLLSKALSLILMFWFCKTYTSKKYKIVKKLTTYREQNSHK